MLKKLNIFLLLCLLVIPGIAEAATFNYGYFGTTSQTSNFIIANGTTQTDTWIDVTVGGGSGQVIWYGAGSPAQVIGTSSTPGTVSAPPGALAFGLKSLDGTEVYAEIGHTTNPNADTVTFSGSSSSGGSGGSGGSGVSTGCDVCQMFSCPGWSQYMGEMNAILAAIPPPPNWDNVAGIFRDTIAPQIKSDLQDVLGNAPDLPGAPNISSDLNGGGPPPTGYDNGGLSGFNSNDVKNQAPTIPEKQDPTGGFTINDPIGSLPPQDEFTKNIPSEPDNPAPANPAEPDNVAPTPTEPDNTAPTPAEPDNQAPTPTEPDNVAPTPAEPDNQAPIPGGTGGFDTPPLPNESGTAPLPGDTNDTAPLPSNDNSKAPLPGQ